jgi:hypothetical protein
MKFSSDKRMVACGMDQWRQNAVFTAKDDGKTISFVPWLEV